MIKRMKSNKLLWILPLMFLLLISFVSAVATAPDSDDVVSYWAMENLTDETGNNNLTNDGAASGATGIIDNSYSFDGTNDYVYGTFSENFVSFSMWFYFDNDIISDSTGDQLLNFDVTNSNWLNVGHTTGSLTNELIYISTGSGEGYWWSFSDLDVTSPFAKETWYYMVIVWEESNSNYRIYWNGIDKGLASKYGTPQRVVADDFYLGRTTTAYMDGKIDEVSIFDVALSSDEVSYLYNSGSPTSEQQYPFTTDTLENFTITTNLNNYSAYINPSYNWSEGICYQEDFQTQTACGGLDTGTTTNDGGASPSNAHDSDYDTKWYSGGGEHFMYINYTIPFGTKNFIWKVKDEIGGIRNITETSNCSLDNKLQFKLMTKWSVLTTNTTRTEGWCWNGLDWEILFYSKSERPADNYFYEEAVYWNITNPRIYNTTTGTTTTNILQNNINLYNITLIPENTYYDNLTFTNYNVSTNINTNFYLQQSLITVNVYDLLGNLITDFNLTSGVETNSTGSVYVEHGENILINFSKSGWYNKTFYIGEVTGSRTVNFTGVYDQIINITAKAQISNTTLSNFSGYVLSGSYLINYNTTESYIEIKSVTNNNYTIFFEKDSYITNTSIITTNESIVYNYEISTYKLNSFYINFKDELTDSIITSTTTLDIISTSFSNNYSTNNGTLYLTLLDPLEYTFRYKSDGYTRRYKYITLFNDTFTALTLYLINSTDVSNITIHIIDQNGFDVEEAIVKAQRYYLSDNVYREVESGLTNPEGETILSLQKNNEFHRFVIDYEGNTIKTTTPFIIESDTYNIQVIIGDVPGIQFDNYNSILYNLSFNTVTNNFNLEYNDLDGIGGEFCLKVYRIKYDGKELQSSVCDTSSSGVLLGSVTNLSGSIWLGEAYWDTNKFLEGKTIEFETENPSGNMGLFMHIFISITLLILGIMLSTGIGVAGLGISFIIGKMIGLNTFPWWVNGMIFTMSIIIAFIIENKSK